MTQLWEIGRFSLRRNILKQSSRVRTGPGKPGKSWNLIIRIPVMEFWPRSWKVMEFHVGNFYAAELPTVLDCLTCMREKTFNYGNM